MDFKCAPDAQALGLNALRIALAVNTAPLPVFRAFSAGGVDSSGNVQMVDPYSDPIAMGGFNPSSNPPGQPTLAVDNVFHFGQADFVVRVSVMHTIWFDTGSTATRFADAVAIERGVLPGAPGTDVAVALRGADSLGSLAGLADADLIDFYGEDDGTPTQFFGGDASWKSDPSDLDGARYVQARITMISDASTGRTTAVDAPRPGLREVVPDAPRRPFPGGSRTDPRARRGAHSANGGPLRTGFPTPCAREATLAGVPGARGPSLLRARPLREGVRQSVQATSGTNLTSTR